MLTRLPLHDRRWTVRAVGDLSRVPPALLGRVVAGVPATLLEEVGGCIHTDLIDAGLIPDPAVGMNETAVEWVGWTDWCYETTFDPSSPAASGGGGGGSATPEGEEGPTPTPETPLLDHHQLDLCFDSLDTLAVIELNGAEVGRANSEFLPWRFNITGLLTPGVNRLRITFTSPLRHVYELAEAHGRPHNGDESTPKWHPYNLMRKCASNFGWDWGPKVPTCGIGGGVRIEGWSTAKIVDPRAGSRWSESIVVRARVETPQWSTNAVECELVATLWDGGAVLASVKQVVSPGSQDGVATTFDKLREWIPGSTNRRYVVELELRANGRPCDHWSGTVGAVDPRVNYGDPSPQPGLQVQLVRMGDYEPDHSRVFCKGANWIPEGLWPRDRTASRLRERLGQAKAAGMNMIRVWGGGRYETEAFYDACDELGIMVWQDFMFACALYPEEEPWRTLVEQEARYQVARLSRHPCVVLWCGGNENHWAYESWGFKERLNLSPSQREGAGGGFDSSAAQQKSEAQEPSPQPPPSGRGRSWGRGFWQDLLPRIVAELSPHTPYIPDSPWSPPPTHPNDPETGDRHTWDLFGEDFRNLVPRFCSEFGVQSPSNLETLQEAELSEPEAQARVLAPGAHGAPSLAGASGSEGVVPAALAARQRGPGGMKRWYDEFFAKAGVSAPATFEAWHAAAQKLQADWLYLAVVWLRANAPRCMGSLIWQLNDAWPGLSWSLIDSAGREKPAYHAVARAYADRLVETVPFAGVPHRVAINDTEVPWEVEPGWVVGARSVDRRPSRV